MTTRDGTQLAVSVRLPGPPEDGPHTVVEYSGYGYANPAGAEAGISPILNLLDYAVVDVNIRGTGCSGGAFDFFERLQGLDGYDVVETVARQPWVLHNKVGMAGVSYGGISQLFVAAAKPPSLAAITPLSVLDNTATTLYPGGILNTGFALEWAEDRVDDAKPATAANGQGWAYDRIQNGDATCAANQVLHTAAADLINKIDRNRFYRPKVADPINPWKFVHKINARLPRLPVQRRADRRPLPEPGRSLHRDQAQVVHLHQRAPHQLAGPRDLQPLVRLPRALCRPAQTGALPAGCRDRLGGLRDRDGRARRDAARRPDPRPAEPRDGEGRLREPAARPGPVRHRRRRAAEPPRPRLRAVVQEPADPGHQGTLLVPRRWGHAAEQGPEEGRQRHLRLGQGRVRPTTSPAPTPPAATSGRPIPASTGSSRPRVAPRPTCPRRSAPARRSSGPAPCAPGSGPRSPTWTCR